MPESLTDLTIADWIISALIVVVTIMLIRKDLRFRRARRRHKKKMQTWNSYVVPAESVRELAVFTGFSELDCRSALRRTHGNKGHAIEYLLAHERAGTKPSKTEFFDIDW